METAVVVPAYNERVALRRALDALRGQADEVCVVVGGDDGSRELAREHAAVDRVFDDEREAGPAAARNRGARAVDADVVCFTDADTVVPDGWVARHASHYHDPHVVGVGGPLRPLDGSRRDELLFRVLSDYWYRVSWPFGFVQASGNNCSYRRDVFLEAGGFDESMPFMEDTDLSLRMRERGRVVYDRHAPVETLVRRQRDEGYAGLFARYAVGYARYFVGKGPREGYFRDW